MTRTTLQLSLAAATISFLTTVSNAQLLNGSFETGLAYPGGPNIFVAGLPTPWQPTTSGFTPDCYDNTGADGWNLAGIPIYNNMFQNMIAAAGHRFIGFGASPSFGGFNESFQQTTPPLTPGASYTISAQLAADDLGKAAPYGGPYTGRGSVNVLLDGNYIGTLGQNTASLTWQARSFTFVAPATSTAVFTFVAQLDPQSGAASYIGIDDIRMAPSPGSMALLGLSGITIARRRRR
jgi:hypothetical protein